jgi:hypothetical protein
MSAFLLSIIFVLNGGAQDDTLPALKGPYLGQEPPGKSPEAFAPSVLSSKDAVHGQIDFYPDGKEIY